MKKLRVCDIDYLFERYNVVVDNGYRDYSIGYKGKEGKLYKPHYDMRGRANKKWIDPYKVKPPWFTYEVAKIDRNGIYVIVPQKEN